MLFDLLNLIIFLNLFVLIVLNLLLGLFYFSDPDLLVISAPIPQRLDPLRILLLLFIFQVFFSLISHFCILYFNGFYLFCLLNNLMGFFIGDFPLLFLSLIY